MKQTKQLLLQIILILTSLLAITPTLASESRHPITILSQYPAKRAPSAQCDDLLSQCAQVVESQKRALEKVEQERLEREKQAVRQQERISDLEKELKSSKSSRNWLSAIVLILLLL